MPESKTKTTPKKIHLIVGARPNYMKAAPLYEELKKSPHFEITLVHTGQHYDEEMSGIFFQEFHLPKPQVYLGVGSGTHAEQTAKAMMRYEEVLIASRPDLVVVFGDVNSTLACALSAVKLHIPVSHVEAGLRSFDRTMPEEINRLLTDHISDYLFTTSTYDNSNLSREGISREKIHLVGNIMLDTLSRYLDKAKKSAILARLGLRVGGCIHPYALMTLHRVSNVDDRKVFSRILSGLDQAKQQLPILFPAHPRTVQRIKEFGLAEYFHVFDAAAEPLTLDEPEKIIIFPPQGYLDFTCLMAHAALVLTDSGGIQPETTFLGVPCLTLRENTEWTVTLEQGTNRLVGVDPDRIRGETQEILKSDRPSPQVPEFWDGRTAVRIGEIITRDKADA